MREPPRDKPLGRSDALTSHPAEEAGLSRCHCLAQGRRKFSELDEDFPVESAVVVEALKAVDAHEEEAREKQLTAPERVASHHTSRGPSLQTLKAGLEQQTEQRLVEPKSSLGKALGYLLGQWPTLTRFLEVLGAPRDNTGAERALKLCIRQRQNALFSATAQRAYIASLLTSGIATCLPAGVTALDYLVAVQEHRPEVRANPGAWLPWNYPAALVPS